MAGTGYVLSFCYYCNCNTCRGGGVGIDMKTKLANCFILFLLLLVIMLDIAGYFVCQDPNAHPDKLWLWGFCSFMTVGVFLINAMYFGLFDTNKVAGK